MWKGQAVLGAFLISFILGFNNFEITFYNVEDPLTSPSFQARNCEQIRAPRTVQ